MRVCGALGCQREASKRCRQCQYGYCSESCQKVDWPRHKPICRNYVTTPDPDYCPSSSGTDRRQLGKVDQEAFSNYTGKLIFSEVDDANKFPVPAWKPIWDQATQATVDGFHADSEKLFRECLRLASLAHGEEHTLICQIHHNLGTTHHRMLQFDRAEDEYLKGLKVADNLVWKGAPLSHDVLVQLLEGLAALYNAQDRIADAEPVCLRSYQISCEVFGEDSPKVVNSLRRLAALRERQGLTEVSLDLLERAYRIVVSNMSFSSSPGTKTRSATVNGELVDLLVRMVTPLFAT